MLVVGDDYFVVVPVVVVVVEIDAGCCFLFDWALAFSRDTTAS